MGNYNIKEAVESGNKKVSVNLQMFSFKDGDMFILYCPALDLSSYGMTEDDAKDSFEQVLETTITYWINKNTLKKDLLKHGWEIKSTKQRKIKAPSFEKLFSKSAALRDILNNKEFKKFDKNIGLPEFA